MPISTPAPIPSWANVTGKPTTVSGFGITDFSSQVLISNSQASVGAIGTSLITGILNSGAVEVGQNTAGSNLNGYKSDGSYTNYGYAGTWKNYGGSGPGPNQFAMGQALFVRIA